MICFGCREDNFILLTKVEPDTIIVHLQHIDEHESIAACSHSRRLRVSAYEPVDQMYLGSLVIIMLSEHASAYEA